MVLKKQVCLELALQRIKQYRFTYSCDTFKYRFTKSWNDLEHRFSQSHDFSKVVFLSTVRGGPFG